MLCLLSPAKTLRSAAPGSLKCTVPVLATQATKLVAHCAALSRPELKKLLGVSDAINSLNFERYEGFAAQAPCLCGKMYDGPAYRGLAFESLSVAEVKASASRLRILSGLYGLLSPMDEVRPYRLDMGKKLATGEGRSNLYDFWGDQVTKALQAAVVDHSVKFVVNVASKEYFKAVTSEKDSVTQTHCLEDVWKLRQAAEGCVAFLPHLSFRPPIFSLVLRACLSPASSSSACL